jgi:hypothetical protein
MQPEQFLRRIFRDSRGYLCLARISRLNGLGFSQFFYRYPDELDQAVEWIEENRQGYGMDIYYCPHLLKRPERKKEFALPSLVLWADLDECHPKNLGKFGEPKPQLVLQTSEGRWQAYWILKSAVKPEVAEEFNHRIAVAYRDFGCDQGGFDLTQLLRVPTLNWKRVSDDH